MHKEMDSSNERKCYKSKEPLIQKLVELKKKKKKGRPEEENFSQETSLPDYPTGFTGARQTE